MTRELRTGTAEAQLTVITMMLSMHGKYVKEEEFVTASRDEMIRLLRDAPWSTKNIVVKCMCILYK